MAKKKLNKRDREKADKLRKYKERAKRMRVLFRDEFSAANGFDLRKPASWTPAQKAKVTRYFREVAPTITGDFVVKRYRRKDSLEAAARASLQGAVLPGQTAVGFSVDPGEKLDVKVRKGKAVVARNGQAEVSLYFDKAAFLEDPKAEVERVLRETDANVFRVIVGKKKQLRTLTRDDVVNEIMFLIETYHPDNVQEGQRTFDEWLNGLQAYTGTEKRTYSRVMRQVKEHKKEMAKRERDRLDKKAADKAGITVKTYRARRTRRMRAKGRQ
jgi:hypothetical protein